MAWLHYYFIIFCVLDVVCWLSKILLSHTPLYIFVLPENLHSSFRVKSIFRIFIILYLFTAKCISYAGFSLFCTCSLLSVFFIFATSLFFFFCLAFCKFLVKISYKLSQLCIITFNSLSTHFPSCLATVLVFCCHLLCYSFCFLDVMSLCFWFNFSFWWSITSSNS